MALSVKKLGVHKGTIEKWSSSGLSQGLFLVQVPVWPRGYKTFFMLISSEHEIFPAHKC